MTETITSDKIIKLAGVTVLSLGVNYILQKLFSK
jgi:hypothetical protein